MGNYKKKKDAAKVANYQMEVSKNLLPIGQCECGGELFMYLKSQEENMYNIYCSKCAVRRNFKDIDKYTNIQLFFQPSMILKTLQETYGDDLVSKTFE